MTVLLVALGAMVGAPARYLLQRQVQLRVRPCLPLGTLAANLLASLVLGVVAGAGSSVSRNVALLVGTGLCGSLSTYSAFAFETMRLANRRRSVAVVNVMLSVVACMLAGAVGFWVGRSVAR